MSSSNALALIGISCCVKQVGDHAFHAVGDKYVRAVSEGAEALPVLLPALGAWYDAAALAARFDGLLITGSMSSVEPHLYGGPASAAGTLHDPDRDATTLPLLRAALAAGVPVLGICRGLQELNVALGGTLHQQIHAVPGRADHRGGEGWTVEERSATVRRTGVRLTPGGVLAGLFRKAETTVNSLHAQGIDRLAEPLAVEAVASDGQIEAVRVKDAAAFALAVQWHPEWRFRENPDSVALFRTFGAAVRAGMAKRQHAAAAG